MAAADGDDGSNSFEKYMGKRGGRARRGRWSSLRRAHGAHGLHEQGKYRQRGSQGSFGYHGQWSAIQDRGDENEDQDQEEETNYDIEINSLYSPKFQEDYEEIEAAVDSGAAVCIMPNEMCDTWGLNPEGAGKTYAAAGNQGVTDEGSRTFPAVTDQWQKRKMTCRVGKVRRMLLAAAEMVKKGNRVVLDPKKSFIENLTTGERTPLYIKNGIFMMKIWVPRNKAQKGPQAAAQSDAMDIGKLTKRVEEIASQVGPQNGLQPGQIATQMGPTVFGRL